MDEVVGVQMRMFPTDNPTVEEALRMFCEGYMVERKFAVATQQGYRYDLREWLSSIAEKHVKSLSTNSLKHYLSHLNERDLQDASRQRKIAAMTTFLRFLEEQGILPADFSSSLVWPKMERKEPRPLSPMQYTAILQEAAANPRDLAMFAMLLQTGIRLSELNSITVESITLPAEPSRDPITGFGVLRLRRKGRLSELVVNYKAARTIQAYLAVRPERPSNALFLNRFGKSLGNRGVEKAFKKYASRAGIPWAHVESLRTTHITEHLARKTERTIVQENAGLRARQMTYYAQFVKEAQIKAMQGNGL